jgi:hypothetical protein
MKKLIKKVLTDKNARSKTVLGALLVSTVVMSPWVD